MSHSLTPKEIYERMKEWRNIKKLHQQARERIGTLEELVRVQAEQIQTFTEKDATQKEIIQTQALLIENLERMIFGRKRKKEVDESDDTDDDAPAPRALAKRDPSSYHRPLPDDAEVTKTEHHPIDACPDCKTPLKRIITKIFYEEAIVLPAANEKPLKTVIKHTVEQEIGDRNRCQVPFFLR